VVEAKSTEFSNEIEVLTRTNVEGKSCTDILHKHVCTLPFLLIKFVFLCLQILIDWRQILKGWNVLYILLHHRSVL
jgi:hypothetical protein